MSTGSSLKSKRHAQPRDAEAHWPVLEVLPACLSKLKFRRFALAEDLGMLLATLEAVVVLVEQWMSVMENLRVGVSPHQGIDGAGLDGLQGSWR